MPALESNYSAQVFAAANETIAPAQVLNLIKTSVAQGQIALSWDAVTTNSDGSALTDLGGYRVYRKRPADVSFTLVGTVDNATLTYTDNSMKDGATYQYAVAAIDSQATPNEGVPSATLECKSVPSVPTGLAAAVVANGINLTWTSVKTADPDLNENLAGYNIYRSTTDGSGYTKIGSAGSAETSYADTSVVNGATYYYVITAYDNSL